MRKFATHFALLALAGTMAAPAFAAPPSGPGGSGGRSAINCSDPAMAKSPACQRKGKPGARGPGMRGPGMQPTTPGRGNAPSPMQHNPPPSASKPPAPSTMQRPPPPSPGPSHMRPGHKGPPAGFQTFRHSFRFPHFAPPPFRAREGFVVPRSYHRSLRPLPRSFFGFYPMYRGYLFFMTPGGDIVVVSPRTYRIVAIL
jgi:hypothetical protein